MKHQVPGLADVSRDSRPEIPDGVFPVRVDGAQFRRYAQKPFYLLRLSILEPNAWAGYPLLGRLYCTRKALWKLGWFLQDFLYDPELLAHEQVDEKALRGLRGVIKISHAIVNGISLINLDGFAPASQWEERKNCPPRLLLAHPRPQKRYTVKKEERHEFATLVEGAIRRIETGPILMYSAIRLSTECI